MPEHSLLLGELPIKDAPSVSLPNGTACLPQHYLFFEHDYASVCDLIVNIDYADRYPIFMCEDTTGIYVQIGIVGHDNYKSHTCAHCKMMYGRKWRIEPRLPISEIVQTTFLALKKAREHEIRELFRLTHADGGVSTPFNNHHDLPLMATHQALLKPKHGETSGCFSKSEAEGVLISALAVCRYDGSNLFIYKRFRRHAGSYPLCAKKVIADGRYKSFDLWSSDEITLAADDKPSGISPSYWISIRMHYYIYTRLLLRAND